MDEPAVPPVLGVRGPEYRGKRAASNSVVVLAGQLTVLVLALVTTPITLDKIGLERFGIWTFASFGIGLLVSDPGFGDMVTRYGAQARVRGDTNVGARVCALGTLAWVAFGLLLAPAVYFATPWVIHLIPSITNEPLSHNLESSAISFLYWSFGFVIFASIQSTVSGRLIAVGDQWLATVIDVATRFIYAAVLLVLLFRGWQLNAIIAATAAQYAVAYVATVVAVATRVGRPYATPRKIEPTMLRELFRFGGWLQFNSLLDTLTFETDPVILTLAFGFATNALWGIAQRLARLITYFATFPQGNVLPAVSASHASGEGLVAMRRIYVRAQMVVVLLGAFLAGTILAFGPIMLKAWLGRPYLNANIATVLVALTMMAGLPRAVTANAILAMGRIGLGVRAQVLAFVVNLVLTAALVWPWGLDGVLFATVVAKVAATSYLLVRFCRILEGTVRELVWSWMAPLLAITTVAAVAGRVAMIYWPAALHQRVASLVALAVLGLGYTVLFTLGLRLTRFFSPDDLRWLKGAAPGRSGRALTPRVVRLISGSSS